MGIIKTKKIGSKDKLPKNDLILLENG